jgi:hypothetical protein
MAFVDLTTSSISSEKMKSLTILTIFVFTALSIIAQPSRRAYVSSVSTDDRLTLVKNSVELTEWHEKSFWAQYNEYLSKTQESSTHAFISVQELSAVDRAVDTIEARQRADRMFALAHEEIASMSEYFKEIGREHNGIIALQFLQTETQLDLMERLFIYEGTSLKKFRLNPGLVGTKKVTEKKYNVLSKALDLTAEEAQVFYPIYTRYQSECNEVLGADYSVYELFAGHAADYSPALAKRLGYDLITLTNRELELKEKYYKEISKYAGPMVASRFLAWEDYYSLICKMTVWAETN